ncbi:MAG: hypothetical protein F6K42_01120 [Leptolyngbya sp. SIO1D8]|nr:hypothetical protein [Leptolyngbya sp. SIO1D8]
MKTKRTRNQHQTTTRSNQLSKVTLSICLLSEAELLEVVGAGGLEEKKGGGPN